uniref:Myb/SANT-like DNA-binding domain-containing protein n=1 Tax=Anopheles epiroticus TaxID=199890 RepID=A0A182PGC9_9DIPT
MTTTSSAASSATGPSEGRPSRISQKQRAPSDGTDSSSCSTTREPWISTNKILNSSLCGRRTNSRNPNFDYDETKLLISLWGDPVVQKTLITTHKKHPVIAELARKMRAHGYNRSTEEINTRIKNLKCFYNRIKKDMAAGIINQTTWRHYAEMDEIISRPVFGNAARLHIQQHQQQQQTKQPKPEEQARHDQDESGKDQLLQLPVKLELMSDDEDDYEPTEIRAEDLLTIDAKFPDDSPAPSRTERTVRGGRGGGTGSKSGKSGSNGRKQTEDDDDDDEDEEDEEEEEEEDDDEGSDFDVENKGNSQSKPTGTAGTKPGDNSGSGLVIQTITSGNGTTITATGSVAATTSSSIPTAGKISVVPTNLLMKQPTSVASSMAAPIQIYTQPTMSIGKGIGATVPGAVGTGPGGTPMKLLLVNTVGKDGTTQQILTPAPEGTGAATGMPKLLPASVHHPKLPISVTGQSPIVTIPGVNVPPKAGVESQKARPTGGQSAGFRTLLTQLVTIQRENLALNQERLALERERLEFEKQFGGSLVGMVRNMSTFFSGMLQQQRKEQQAKDAIQQPPNGKPFEPKGPKEADELPSNVAKEPESAADAVSTGGGASLELSEISSSPSSSASTSRVASPTSTTKAPTAPAECEPETKEPTGMKRSAEPSSSSSSCASEELVAAKPASGKPSSTSDVSLPKKRRMMTRNATQQSQQAGDGTDDPLKTEIISDADDQRAAAAIRLRLRKTVLAQRHRTAGGKAPGERQGNQQWTKMWVSTNKVLIGSVGGLKKPHCRNPNFDCEETKLLISLWGDPQVQRTLITTHKKHPVIAKLAERMREYGYNRSTEEINTRIKNLKCFYNRIKKDLETGVINEPSWKHFQAMDEILTRPVFGGANAPSRYQPTAGGGVGGGSTSDASVPAGGRITRPRLSAGSIGGADLDPDQIEVKLELVSDEEKELRPEELLKNAEQVELKEPNLLIPKDEPMEEEEDDPNDPDFEDDGGSETDDESSGMDEADESDRSTRLRRRTRRAHKQKKPNSTAGGKQASSSTATSTSVTGTSTKASTSIVPQPAVPGTIKIINYAGGGSINISSAANVVSAVSSGSATAIGTTTPSGKSDATTTSTATSSTTTPSKISLVPTNFLLKPQASNLGFKQPIQLYTKPTVSIATTMPTHGLSPIASVNASVAGGGTASTTTSTVATAGGPAAPGAAGPVKVYLVNTLSKDGTGPKQQLITPSTAKQIYTTSTGVSLQGTSHVSGLPQISIQPNQLLTGGTTGSGPGSAPLGRKILHTATVPPLRPAFAGATPPKLGGFKTLLQQLVGLQRENLAITKTRLVAEKERFGNEKSVANSLLDALGELNALLSEVNGEPIGKESDEDGEEGMIKISTDSPVSSPRRCTSRQEESVKPEVISDSSEES